jgi:hypothetical protein
MFLYFSAEVQKCSPLNPHYAPCPFALKYHLQLINFIGFVFSAIVREQLLAMHKSIEVTSQRRKKLLHALHSPIA